jgi:hypothetical protein
MGKVSGQEITQDPQPAIVGEGLADGDPNPVASETSHDYATVFTCLRELI